MEYYSAIKKNTFESVLMSLNLLLDALQLSQSPEFRWGGTMSSYHCIYQLFAECESPPDP